MDNFTYVVSVFLYSLQLIKINNITYVQYVVNRFFLSSVPHNIRHSRAIGNPGNGNCHSRIPWNKNTRPGMETLVICMY